MIEKDPPRLLDTATGDPRLHDALRVASQTAPSAAQLQALALKVSAATGVAGASASASQSLFAWLGQSSAVKITIALVVAGSAAWFGLRPPTTPQSSATTDTHVAAPEPPPSATHIETAPAPEPAAKASTPITSPLPPRTRFPSSRLPVSRSPLSSPRAPDDPAIVAPPASKPARGERRARVQPKPRSVIAPIEHAEEELEQTKKRSALAPSEAATRGPSELELLGRAQALLARDPSGALNVIDEHASAYPRGAYREEREALAIDALRRLGRGAEAEQRSRAFLQRYPTSAHGDRIKSGLQ